MTGPSVPDHRSKVNRFFLPLIGLLVALTAYALQSVWGLVNVKTIAAFIRSRDITGMMLCIGVLGLVEATVIACRICPAPPFSSRCSSSFSRPARRRLRCSSR